MGPYGYAESNGQLFDDVQWLHRFEKANPGAIVTRPSESPSLMWEVSLPDKSAMAFSDLGVFRLGMEEISRSAG
jgi:hypothetical protein